jgi:hypothetical protein
MKKSARLFAFISGCMFLISCGSKDFKNQPWMPSSVKGKHKGNSNGSKNARYTIKSHSDF